MTRYRKLVKNCKRLGIDPPRKKPYSKAYTALKDYIDELLEIIEESRNELPDSIVVIGESISSLTDPTGKRTYISGKNLRWEAKT